MQAPAPAVEWRPHAGQQERFLGSSAFEALFGGQAGPGKTECLVMEALRQIDHPKYTGILFRRTFPMLEQADGMIQRSLVWYPPYGGRYNDQKHYWKFPSGARIYFGHMQRRNDMYIYQGAQFAFVGFDELTEFKEEQYLYMFTRCRPGSADLLAYIRAATNPGNIGHRWVKKRFITRDIANRTRWFARQDGEDIEVSRDHPEALSRVFYPAALEDNPSADPRYLQRILATGDSILIARLAEGNWDAEYNEGLIYDTWSNETHVSADADYNPDLPVYWGCDDGYVFGDGPGSMTYHPRVVLFFQDNAMGGLNVFDEYVQTEETHEVTLESVLGPVDGSPSEAPTRWQGYRRPTVAYVDGSAAMFRGELTRRGVSSVNATHRVAEGIKAVRQNLATLRVHPRCQATIYEFTAYRSDLKGRADGGEIVPLKIDDHSMDGLRYVVYNRRHHLRGG